MTSAREQLRDRWTGPCSNVSVYYDTYEKQLKVYGDMRSAEYKEVQAKIDKVQHDQRVERFY